MTLLAYQTLNTNPTGQEIELGAPTMRHAAQHLAHTLNGTVCCTGKSVQVGEFTWQFLILQK